MAPDFATESQPFTLRSKTDVCHLHDTETRDTVEQVPLGTLADDRCMEGTFPLVPVPVGDDAPEKNLGHEEDGLQANGTVVPDQRCSIELAVYLYRMGPHSVPRDGDVQSWRPPSLLEKGRICCGDGPITLFERAPVLDE